VALREFQEERFEGSKGLRLFQKTVSCVYCLTICVEVVSQTQNPSFARRLGAQLTAAKNVQMCTNSGVSEVRYLLPEMHIQGVGEPDKFQVKGTLVQNSIDVTATD